MPLGYDKALFILAFDHRGSFQKQWYGIEGDPSAEQTERISAGKELVFDGLEQAVRRGADAATAGGLVDEQFGAPRDLPERIAGAGMVLAMPVERSGQTEFDFEYGDRFGEHIERFDPDFVKVLVRYNPDGDRELNARQAGRLRTLSEWLAARERRFLFELLVPATDAQLESVGGDGGRYDAELRPALMVGAIAELQDAGVEAYVWKIEGLDRREDCERVVAQSRAGGRDEVACVLLGRGADRDQVERWIRTSAGVEGFVGFAIGRSIWGEPLAGYLADELDREAASREIADRYLGFHAAYADAAAAA